jgi:hypothetical protein
MIVLIEMILHSSIMYDFFLFNNNNFTVARIVIKIYIYEYKVE